MITDKEIDYINNKINPGKVPISKFFNPEDHKRFSKIAFNVKTYISDHFDLDIQERFGDMARDLNKLNNIVK